MKKFSDYWADNQNQGLKEKLEISAEKRVKQYRQKNKPSEGEVALEALSIYRSCMLPPPEWATEVLRESWEIYKTGIDGGWWGEEKVSNIKTFASFDEVLGLQIRTKKSASARHKKMHLIFPAYKELERLYHNENFKLDKEIFEEAGRKFGVSGALVNKYYQIVLRMGFPAISEVDGDLSPIDNEPLKKE